MKRLEIDEEKDYCLWLREEYPPLAIALKLILFVGMGFPDRTVLSQGKIFFIEFKRPDGCGRLSGNQRVWRRRLKRLGFKVYVCKTKAEAIEKTIRFLDAT